MKRRYFPVLFFSIFFLTAMVSCKKDTIEPPTTTTGGGNTHVTTTTLPSQTDEIIYSWNAVTSGVYSVTIFGMVNRINTAHSTSLQLFIVNGGQAYPLDKPVTFSNGILLGKIQSPDVNITYQAFQAGPPPYFPVTIRIVAQ